MLRRLKCSFTFNSAFFTFVSYQVRCHTLKTIAFVLDNLGTSWTEDSMQKAMDELKGGEKSGPEVCEDYNIPSETLFMRINIEKGRLVALCL